MSRVKKCDKILGREVALLLVALCYRNKDKLHPLCVARLVKTNLYYSFTVVAIWHLDISFNYSFVVPFDCKTSFLVKETPSSIANSTRLFT